MTTFGDIKKYLWRRPSVKETVLWSIFWFGVARAVLWYWLGWGWF